MELAVLKDQIIKGIVDDTFKIFIYEDTDFLVNQYVTTISELRHLDKNYITSLNELNKSALDLVFDQPTNLNILHIDNFSESMPDFSIFDNTVVICTKVDSKIKDIVNPYITTFPKLKDWQIIDYIQTSVKVLSKEDAEWLYQATNKDLYWIDNELAKVSIFSPAEQLDIFRSMQYQPESSLYQISNYALADLIVKQNKLELNKFMQYKDAANIDPIAVIAILLSTFKKILFVNFNSGVSIEQLGLTQKQINAIRYYYKNFSFGYVAHAVDFLSGLDLRLKQGKLDMPKELLFDYILGKLGE